MDGNSVKLTTGKKKKELSSDSQDVNVTLCQIPVAREGPLRKWSPFSRFINKID